MLELGWSAEDREDNWLISYADLLSVIFAMVVLLFGRMLAATTVGPDAARTALPDADAERPQSYAHRARPRHRHRDARTGSPLSSSNVSAAVSRRAGRDRGIALAIPAVALFTSARADLEPAAIPLLTELAATLREVGDARIAVEGHTDDLPVQGGTFDSNWSLAAARANAVTRFLLDQGFAPGRLQSVSYADTRPVADNSTADGRAANRRVELQIELAGEAGGLR